MTRHVETSAPVTLFQGYDSFLSEPRAVAVKGSASPGGTSGYAKYTVCQSIEEVSKALNITASVAASCGFGSIDAKTEFTSKLRVTDTSVHIIVYARAITESFAYTGAEFAVAPPEDVADFFMTYGDSWVSSLARGGEYAAVYSFHSRSSEEQRKVVSSLEAHGISTEGQLTVSLQTTFQQDWSSLQVEKSLHQFMQGARADVAFPDEAEIIPFSMCFASKVAADTAVTVWHGTADYLHVPGFPTALRAGYRRVVHNVESFKAGRAGREPWATTYANLCALADSVKATHEICRTYGYVDQALHASAEFVQADIAALADLFETLEEDPTAEVTLPALKCVGWHPPVLNVALDTVVLSGGDGESIYNDVSLQDVLDRKTLSHISLRGARVVDSLTAGYRKGQKTELLRHGGDGGDGPYEFDLGEGERITGITVRFGNVVNQLVFTTSKAQNAYTWPREPRGWDGELSWHESGSTRLLGFSGSCGWYLDRLHAVTVTFSPASFGPSA